MGNAGSEKVKKEKKSRKALWGVLIAAVILVAVLVVLLIWKRQAASGGEETALEDGQYYVYGQIASINGNEMTYDVAVVENQESGEMPQMPGGADGQRPEMGSGEMPQMPEGMSGQMPDVNSGEMSQEMQKTQYKLSGESVTVLIPVGTQVTTKLGTVTTFSRLAAGDTVKMLVQEENGEQIILEMWIVD